MKITVTAILISITIAAKWQQIDWHNTRNWTIYNIHNGNAFRYSADILKYFKKISLDDSILLSLLNGTKILPEGQHALWMGFYVASFESAGGLTHKIDISVYGVFL